MAEWVSALAALGALVAAVFAGIAAWRLYKIEDDREQRAQARQVSAWISVKLDDQDEPYGIELTNGSLAPVYDVTIRSTNRNGVEQPALNLTVLPPGRFFAERAESKYHWDHPDPADDFSCPLRPVARTDKWQVRELIFRDSANVTWDRDAAGVLRKSRLRAE
ncbi:hypothetical protein JOF29_007029 [Kribbella aluminosa]|uniref:Uncharacterized protein n=1 Tax=Kribbella aluminosa TaxID=416017 RepID=A0ABS4UW91_9ACTN|nr:hypothetical protein [Kribbella aluminosa]MBP2355919.1 hypothetical protein [Kribbella aluminosa]